MYIQRVLLLTAILLAVFAPALGVWIFSPPAPWHRPFMVWLLIIIIIFASQRANEKSLQKHNRRKSTSSDQEHPRRRASDNGTDNAV